MPDLEPALQQPALIMTASLSAFRHIQADACWLITRKSLDKPVDGIIWVPELAPSPELFHRARQDWRGNVRGHWPAYVACYERELQNGEKRQALRNLWRLSIQGHTIALLCYCPRPDFCHRSLVAKFLRSHGADVREYEPAQASLFP